MNDAHNLLDRTVEAIVTKSPGPGQHELQIKTDGGTLIIWLVPPAFPGGGGELRTRWEARD